MNCTAFDKIIIDYIEENLNPEQVKEVEEHLNKCQKCGVALNNYKNFVLNIQKLPELECPDSVTENVYNSLPEEKTKPSVLTEFIDSIREHFVWKLGFAAAAIIIIITVFSIYSEKQRIIFNNKAYTAEDVERAEKDVKLALAYINYCTVKTELIVENTVIKNSLIKSINSTVNKIIKPN